MLIYETFEKANQAEDTRILPSGTHASSAIAESDWGSRLRGYGQPGGRNGGWLLTFQRPVSGQSSVEPAQDVTGVLIAYEFEAGDRTGRVGIVRRSWTGQTDQRWSALVQQRLREGWKGSNMEPGGEADLEEVDELLPGQKL